MASLGYSPPHSCQSCQKMVLEFSEDPKNPDTLSKTCLDLARKSSPDSKDPEGDVHIELFSRNIVLFDMTLEDLETNVVNGCLLCDWLLQEHHKLEYDWESKLVLAADCEDDNIYFGTPVLTPGRTEFDSKGVSGKLSVHVRRFLGVCFQMVTLPGNPAAKNFRTRPVNINPASENVFSLARGWLKTCLEEHMSCPKPTGDFMPTRLLEILYRNGSRRLRLWQTKQGKKERYAALTYCWGLERPFISTKRTIGQLLTRFNFEDLPPSIRDAVLVTEKLGLRFLWVDAICIVQDDEHEKAWEIAQMPLVYNQATITIAASRASGIEEGFLSERPALGKNSPQLVFELPYRSRDGEIGSVVLVPKVRESTEPLDRRAWALQERLLSSRILEYGSLQTRWICQHAERDKDLIDGWKERKVYNQERSDTLFVEAFQTVLTGLPYQEPSDIAMRKKEDSLDQWHQIVQLYTRRALSFPTDRLPAISGIAERYGRILRDDYAGGLWRSRLPEELLWISEVALGPRPLNYQGPSWSWAAIDNPISFIRVYEVDEKFEVLNCQVLPSIESAVFGAVQSGHLKLKGRIRPAKWIDDGRVSSFMQGKVFRSSDINGFDELLAASITIDSQENEMVKVAADVVSTSGRESVPVFVPVFLLLVGKQRGNFPCGLVLHLQANGEYSRLGVFKLDKGYNRRRPEESEGSWSKRYQEQFDWLCECEPQEVTII